MNQQDKTRFAELMMWLAQTFRTDISRADIANYWLFLHQFSLSEVEQAIRNYGSQNHGFMPKPGEIAAYIQGNSTGLALLAWSKVTKTLTHIGCYQSVIFDDAIINAVLHDMGGWIKIGALTEKELSFYAREFEKRYLSYLITKPKGYPKQLTGIIETTNAAYGYSSTTPPLLIGDKQRALLVYQQGQDTEALLPYTPLPLTALQQSENNYLTQGDKTNEQNA